MPPKPAGMHSLEYVLLGMLAQQPRHGYELHKELSNLEGLGSGLADQASAVVRLAR